MGVRLKPQLWAAVAMALGGVALLTLDGATSVGGSGDGSRLHDLLLGDAYCVGAAAFYAAYDVRVNAWSRRAATLPLTLWKTACQMSYSVAFAAALVALGLPQGAAIIDWFAQVGFATTVRSPTASVCRCDACRRVVGRVAADAVENGLSDVLFGGIRAAQTGAGTQCAQVAPCHA